MDRSRTKLVCTIGPASVERIGEMVAAGMDVARINFSHGTPDDHRAYVHAVRAAAHSARRSVAVMADLPGPKIRLGVLQGDAVTLETGATFVLRPAAGAAHDEPADLQATEVPAADVEAANDQATELPTDASQPDVQATEGPSADDQAAVDAPPADAPPAEAEAQRPEREPDASGAEPEVEAKTTEADTAASAAEPVAQAPEPEAGASGAEPGAEAMGDASGASVSRPGLAAQLEEGDRILLADGAAELRVIGTEGGNVTTEVVNGGTIRSRSGVNIPSARLTGNGLTQDDLAAIPRALELRVDLIAQSFVRTADDVKALRATLPADGPRVVAKIETRAAIDAFDDIVQVADGIMVARGDMGVDIPFEDVPLVQKDLVRRSTRAGRFSIVATQMLESMTAAPRPTRAEASDVANAVLDGADAVMLSAETAIGKFPLESLQAMARISLKTETGGATLIDHAPPPSGTTPADAIIAAANNIAAQASHESAALWCFTRSGRTAELLSLQRPGLPIVAFTLNPIVARRLAVRSGVIPMVLSSAGGRGEPLLDRMASAWRAQKNRTEFATVILVTTSRNPSGINRIEVHSMAVPTNAKAASTH